MIGPRLREPSGASRSATAAGRLSRRCCTSSASCAGRASSAGLQGLSPRFVRPRRRAAGGSADGAGGVPAARGVRRWAAGTSATGSASRTSTSRRRSASTRRIVFAGDVEIVHHGRVVQPQQHRLRRAERDDGLRPVLPQVRRRRWPLFWYKLAVTLDAPVQLVGRRSRRSARRATGQRRTPPRAGPRPAASGRSCGTNWCRFWKA